MLNELLREQLERYLSPVDEVPAKWLAFLEAVSSTYDNLRNEHAIEDKLKVANAEVIKDLNIRLKNETEELKEAHAELGRILNSVNHGFFSRDISRDNYNYLSLACERVMVTLQRNFSTTASCGMS